MKKKQKKRKAARQARQMRVIAVEAQDIEPVFELSESAMKQVMDMGLSQEDVRQALRDSARAEMPEEDGHYCWIETVYDSAFVYERVTPNDRQLYRRDYSIDAEGNVLLGIPMAVRKVVSYEPEDPDLESVESREAVSEDVELEESATAIEGPLVPLMETKVRSDGTLPILLINEGWGSSGYYSREVLERDASVFTKGIQMHLDHMTRAEEAQRPEGSVTTLAAVLESDAYFKEDGPEGPGVYADAKVLDHQKGLIEALAPHVGLSIRASGIARPGEADGKKGPIIERIVQAKRVDFVTMAGRGGKVLQIMESASFNQEEEPTQIKESGMNEQKVKELQESNEKLAKELAELKEDNARKNEAIILREAADVVAVVISEDQYKSVPEMTLARVREAQSTNPPVKDGALDTDALKTRVAEAIKAEVQYLAELTGSGKVRSMGGGTTQVSESQGTEGNKDKLRGQFQRLGLSESEATHAATGR